MPILRASSRTVARIINAVERVENKPEVLRRRRRQRESGGQRALIAQPVWVRKVSGVPGDVGHPCTFAYDGWVLGADLEDDSQRLFVDEQPLAPRTVVGKHDESPEDCPAWAVLVKLEDDDVPTWHLWYAPGERWNVPGPCQPCLPGGLGSVGIMAV